MPDKKIIFIAFPIEDERQRDFLKGQTQLGHCPYEYIDMSVKDAYDTGWKERVRIRIKRSNGVIVLVSKDSLTSTGQKWEIQCAREEGKPILAIWSYKADRTYVPGLATQEWSFPNVGNFIDNI